MTYYHGGVPGLHLGDQLLPPSKTGAKSLAQIAREHRAEIVGPVDHMRDDRVFLVTDIQQAMVYAAMYPRASGGWIYAAEPVDPVERDPDYLLDDGGSVQCPSAIVVRVIGPLPVPVVASIRRALR
jgi:hypothetical protein